MARRKKRDPLSALFQPKHVYLPGTQVLRQVDIDRLAEELDVDAQGRADGADEVPPADGRSLAVKEREIVGRVREIWDETVEGARRAYEAYRGRYASYTADTDIDSLLAEPAAVAVKLREAAREDRARLEGDYDAVRMAQSDLERFREREGITHPPRTGQSRWMKVAVLALAAFVEFAVNAAIFGAGDAGGVLGAVLKVVIIPVANIGGCWLWTHWLARQVLMRNPLLKAVGLVGCALAGVWLIGLNLAVAHWRESADAVISIDAARASFDSALAHPLALHSFQSWGLFLIGCFAGAAAIWEGWSWKDPHPGYSRREEQARMLADEWWGWRQDALDRLEEIREENTRRFSDAQRRAEIAIAERPSVAAAAGSLAEDVRLFADHLRYVCEELGARYREANLRAREGERPSQFEAPLTLTVELPVFPPLTGGAEQRAVAGRLSDAIREVTQAFSEACASIPSPGDLDSRKPQP